ncbi:MAG: hypothetical protein AAF492_24800, partial [Verrucomicrobiota bacterium]
MGLILQALPGWADNNPGASEIWVLPSRSAAYYEKGNWAVARADTHFGFAIPDDFVSIVSVKILVIGRRNVNTHYHLDISMAQNGLRHDDFSQEQDDVPFSVDKDRLTEIDVTDIFPDDADIYPGLDYATLEFRAHNRWDALVVGLRFQYVDDDEATGGDGDTDPANELNSALVLQGDVLKLSDAGGTLSVNLGSLSGGGGGTNGLNDSLSLNSSNVLVLTDGGGPLAVDLSGLINDADANSSNELNSTLSLQGDVLHLTDGGGTLSVNLASLAGSENETNELNFSLVLNGTQLELTD